MPDEPAFVQELLAVLLHDLGHRVLDLRMTAEHLSRDKAIRKSRTAREGIERLTDGLNGLAGHLVVMRSAGFSDGQPDSCDFLEDILKPALGLARAGLRLRVDATIREAPRTLARVADIQRGLFFFLRRVRPYEIRCSSGHDDRIVTFTLLLSGALEFAANPQELHFRRYLDSMGCAYELTLDPSGGPSLSLTLPVAGE